MDDQQRPPEPSTSDQRPHEGQSGRRHPKGHQTGRGCVPGTDSFYTGCDPGQERRALPHFLVPTLQLFG